MDEKKKSKEPKKAGRPSQYTPELGYLICERIATNTVGISRLCSMYEDMPVKDTIRLWRFKHPEFSAQYAQAKMHQADLMAEECSEIADDATNDWMESFDEEGALGWKINGEHIHRSRLRIDTRKWLASKLLPKQYGDKLLLEQKTEENEKLKAELLELRHKLDSQNRREF